MTSQVSKHIGWFMMAFIFGYFVRLPVSDAIETDTARIINLESIPFHASIDNPPLDSQNHYIFKLESGEYTQQWDTLITDIEKVHQAGELWIRANLPVIDFKDPVLYLEGIFSHLRVFRMEFKYTLQTSCKLPQVGATINFIKFHYEQIINPLNCLLN